VPTVALSSEEQLKNNLPDVLTRWGMRAGDELNRARTEQSFCVPKADIVVQGYDLSFNRYKEVVHEEVDYRPPLEILTTIALMEAEIQKEIRELEAMLQ
jgi:type I restriction enzyme M protein